ncbi:MAG: hypothetical protein FWF00_07320 [Endomicrobia bacterium]|nr:hypothetical protein [Endomicrobiia bacterium]MCL2507476.1 hypothetical protein [Endomicrobiia bacterium]
MKLSFKKITCFLVMFLMLAGSVPVVYAMDTEAEIEKLSQDFEDGKISMSTFMTRMMEIQKQVIQELEPEVKQQIKQVREAIEDGSLMRNVEEALQAMEAGIEYIRQIPERKAKRDPDRSWMREFPVPPELLAILPKGQQQIYSSGIRLYDEYADINVSIRVYVETKADDGDVGTFTFRIIAFNPDFNDISYLHAYEFKNVTMEDVKKHAAEKGITLRQRPWGWGYSRTYNWETHTVTGRLLTGTNYEGEYVGVDGDVTFTVGVAQGGAGYTRGTPKDLDNVADKLGELTKKTLTYENLRSRYK